MNEKDRVFHTIIRVPKSESAFVYFQLEANEGLCFYSTLENSLGEGHRDIEIKSDISTQVEVERVIDFLKQKIAIEILK
jgi:hypothetical protein